MGLNLNSCAEYMVIEGWRKMPKRLLLVDLDGTLYDTSARFNECQKISGNNRKMFWECFQSERFMSLDRSNQKVVDFVKALIEPDSVIVVVSGRSETQYNKTVEQLQTIGITPTEIYLRPRGNFKKDYEFKGEVVEQLLKKYNNVSEIIMVDDSNDVLSFIQSKYPQIKTIDAKSLLNS